MNRTTNIISPNEKKSPKQNKILQNNLFGNPNIDINKKLKELWRRCKSLAYL
ncbi:MAG: hypothetical protein GY830_03865 [Bacteroidetes bacterium]|nr:hypothetical protein [Bacteroidota bacterium]